MSKKIKLKLSSTSIDKAIEEIEEYRRELRYKTVIFVQRLAEEGLAVVEDRKTSFRGDADGNDVRTYVIMSETKNKVRATLVMAGKDVAFIEFGAGAHYNSPAGTSLHPKGQELGFTIGSYGKGQGANDSWVYFDEELARFRTSHGTRAATPMYSASEAIKRKFYAIAKEVFE